MTRPASDPAAVERAVRQLPEVVACRAGVGSDARIESVEVVVRHGADVVAVREAVLGELAEGFGAGVDSSSVFVYALPGAASSDGDDLRPPIEADGHEPPAELPAELPAAETGPAPRTTPSPSDGRARIANIALDTRDAQAEAKVSLDYAGRTWAGVSRGPNTGRRRYQLIAEATLSGLEQILGEPGLFSVEDLRVVDVGGGPTVVVVLELTSLRAGQRLSGSCPASSAHGSPEEATVRATLQAVNRVFSHFVSRAGGHPA